MSIVKYNNEIVEVISIKNAHLSVLTRESEVKRVALNETSMVSSKELHQKLANLRQEKIISLREYRIIKSKN